MILFDEGALNDLERIFGFNSVYEPAWAELQLDAIQQAVASLEHSPYIGRRVPKSDLRELVIALKKTGYVALYHFSESEQLVRILAIRHQREAGYREQ